MQRPIITHISGFVAGRKIDQKLSAKNLIVAPNHAGKTTLLNCARLALLGYLPELGKLNEATFDLAYLDRLEANVALSDGRALSRSWHRNAKGIEQRKNLPADFSADIPLLNHKEYFGLSASEQIDYVFSRVQMSDQYGIEIAIASIEKVTGDSNDITTDDEEAVEQVVKWMHEHFQAEGQILNAALIAMTKDKGRLATEYTKYNRAQRDSEGAARTAIELQAKSGDLDEENVKGLEGQVQTLQKQLAEKSKALGAAIQDAEMTPEDVVERIEELERELSLEPINYDESLRLYTNARSKMNLEPYSKEEDEKILAKRDKLQSEIENLSTQSLHIERTVKELEEEREGLSVSECCKTCMSDAPGWKTRRLEKLESELTQVRLEQSGVDAKFLKKQSELGKVEKQRVELANAFHNNTDTAQRIAVVDARIAEVKREAEQATKDRTDWSSELARLKTTAPIRAEIDKVNTALGELRGKVRDAHALKEQIRLAEHAIAKHQREKAFAVVIKKAKENLIALQGEMVAQVFGPIVETGNKILGGLLKTPLVFESPYLGRWEREQFVKYKTFSGMETEICYAAIASALSADSAMRVLLLDELGRLTPSVQAKVLIRLSEAVDRGDLDQIIVAIPRDSALSARDGWTLVTPQ